MLLDCLPNRHQKALLHPLFLLMELWRCSGMRSHVLYESGPFLLAQTWGLTILTAVALVPLTVTDWRIDPWPSSGCWGKSARWGFLEDFPFLKGWPELVVIFSDVWVLFGAVSRCGSSHLMTVQGELGRSHHPEASLLAQVVMWGTQIQSRGQEDPLEKGWLPSPVFLPGEIHVQRSLAG